MSARLCLKSYVRQTLQRNDRPPPPPPPLAIQGVNDHSNSCMKWCIISATTERDFALCIFILDMWYMGAHGPLLCVHFSKFYTYRIWLLSSRIGFGRSLGYNNHRYQLVSQGTGNCTWKLQYVTTRAPVNYRCLISISEWISYYMYFKIWDYLSVPKPQWLHRWRLGMDK